MASLKDNLITALEELAEIMTLAGENEFKVRAYRNAASTLSREAPTDARLKAIASGDEKIPGIGEGIRAAMTQFISTGAIAATQESKAAISPAILELTKVPGISAKKAKLINEELGVATLGELEYACRENRLVTLKGFGEATQKKILGAMERLKHNAGKRRIDEAHDQAAQVTAQMPKAWKATPIGELGRGCEVVTCLEFAVHGAPQEKLDSFAAKHTTELPVQITAVEKPFSELPLFEQQRLMAGPAFAAEIKKKGVPEVDGEGAPFEFSWLEDEWFGRVPPKGAYRRAVHGAVRGVFHNHTNASDGGATLEEMVHAAEKRGYEYIGISDHSQSAFYAHGLKAEALEEQHDAIRKLQKKVRIKIFHGVESDILQDGALDYPKAILAKLDFVVGSIHSRFQMDGETMTARLTKALAHPLISFWGHPTGRLLLARDAYSFDWAAVAKAAAKSGVAFEVNANPHRLDLDWRQGALVTEHRIPLCINPDAHAVDGLADTAWGELMAEKAMVPAELVLNLRGVEAMDHWLHHRKKAALS